MIIAPEVLVDLRASPRTEGEKPKSSPKEKIKLKKGLREGFIISLTLVRLSMINPRVISR